MVFSSGLIQLPIINTHSPPSNCPSREEFVLLITHYYHPLFLRNHLDWAYPTTVRDGINDTDISTVSILRLKPLLSWLGLTSFSALWLVCSILP